MDSLTKRRLTDGQVADLVHRGLRRAGGAAATAEVVAVSELTDGAFSAVYAVGLADGRDLVLKVAPDPTVRLLRYEVDVAHIESEFYRRAAAAGVPLPRLHAADPDAGYLLLERLRGRSLHAVRGDLTAAQAERLRHDVGGVGALLRTVTADRFGYPRRDGRTRSTSWRTTFLAFMDDILADAVEYGRELPAPAATVRRLVARHAALLDAVTRPVLVHFDLWDGNVFVVAGPGGGGAVEGIIDGERAFYGDPIAELVSLALFTDPDEVPGLLPGFLGRPLTAPERTRLRLYTVYLYLIMVTEDATRGFDPAEHEPLRRYVLGLLDAELGRL